MSKKINKQRLRDLEIYESVKRLQKDEEMNKNTRVKIISALNEFLNFMNLNSEVVKTPDDLIKDAGTDLGLDETEDKIKQFYKWLQGKPIEGYPDHEAMTDGRHLRESSAKERCFSKLVSFYRHSRIGFSKGFAPKISKESKALKADNRYPFLVYDEEKRETYIDHEPLKTFLGNLTLRDQGIALAMLSSSRDSGEVLALNMKDFRQQKGSKRFYYEASREKTNEMFQSFFSAEATKKIRDYIDQERKLARDDDALFVYTPKRTNGNGSEPQRLDSNHLADNFRNAARKMGAVWASDEQNPFRPKRLRHLFRTACDKAGLKELYIKIMMGHALTVGEGYSESAELEKEYSKVEPLLSVFGEGKTTEKLREDVDEIKKRNEDLFQLLTMEKSWREEDKRKFEDRLKTLESQSMIQKDLLEVMEAKWREMEEELRAAKQVEEAEHDFKTLPQE
jgi:hypothetical protein